MDVLSLKEMAAREEKAFHSGISAAALMEAAGEAMARRIEAIYPGARKYLVLTGKGNNGGDGLVVARHLAETGRPVEVLLAAPESALGELPRRQLARLEEAAWPVKIGAWRDGPVFPGSDGVVIDALLGIQARGALRGYLAGIVAQANAARARLFFRTVALDLPSGLAAYEEEAAPGDRDAAIVADVTLAVGFAKNVLVREALSAWVGRLEVVPWSGETEASSKRQVLLGHELAGLLQRRSALSHKGNFGRLVIIAGSTGFTGAAVLCTQGALAMGPGLLSVVVKADAYPVVAAHAPPEAMVSPWPDTGKVPDAVRSASAIVFGPGLGVNERTFSMLRSVLAVGCPILIDADGLNTLARRMHLLRGNRTDLLLTPHPGEMSRLAGAKVEPAEREVVAREFADAHGVALVLKGTRTLVTARDQPFYFNTTGNPGLSAGGSGDTLSGILGALLAQGLKPLEAARLGVWLHGHAADLALSERGCEEGLTGTSVSAHVGAALVSLRAQAQAPRGLLERAEELESQDGD